MSGGRTLHVRCTTWEQVEVFHTRKLRRGKLLSMKVPFHSDRGSAVTLNLELPNQVIVAIEGIVLQSSPVEADPKQGKRDTGKTWLEVELFGFTEELIAQIRGMADGLPPELGTALASEPAPGPAPDPAPDPALAPASDPASAPTLMPELASVPEPALVRGRGSAPVPMFAPELVPTSVPVFAPELLSAAVPMVAPELLSAAMPMVAPELLSAAVPMAAPVPVSARVPRVRRLSASQGVASVLAADERAVFQHLTAELRRLRTAAVHEVLGVARDADADEIRLGWMDLMRRYHPDLVARRNAPAITHLAEELTILVNRAYDRLRVALVAEGRATAVGPALTPPPGWLVGFDDIPSSEAASRGKLAPALPDVGNAPPSEPSPPPPQAEGGEAFEQRARAMLGDGDADNAQEVLAAALYVYPRSRPLRSLYYVASAISALAKGEVMLATSQLETAVAHHEGCSEAAALLELLRRPNTPVADDEMKRLFR